MNHLFGVLSKLLHSCYSYVEIWESHWFQVSFHVQIFIYKLV